MHNKKLLLIGGNFYPELTGIGKYNGEMIDQLSRLGFQCSVMTSYPYYPHWKVQAPYTRRWFWFQTETKPVANAVHPVTVYRVPQYVPGKPSGMKRMASDFSFSFSCFIKIVQLIFLRKFDYVITVAPGFHVGLMGILYKWLRGAKIIYHVQDLQIDAARDLNMIKQKGLLAALLKVERYILRKADYVSTISPGMMKRIEEKCHRPVLFFPNWADTDALHPVADKATLKAEFGFDKNDFVVLYSGAIGEKQGLEDLLKTSRSLTTVAHMKFVICGSGPYKETLVRMKEDQELTNVFFLPLQPIEKLNRLLNMADVHLVLQKANTSDLVMPSKLTNILSVGGVAIVAASEGSSLHQLVKEKNIGILIEPENTEALAGAVKKAAAENTGQLSTNASNYAREYLAIDRIFSRFVSQLA